MKSFQFPPLYTWIRKLSGNCRGNLRKHPSLVRYISGNQVKPFEARLTTGEEGNEWKLKTIEESIADKITKLLDEGYSQKDIAEELEISKGYTSKLVKKIRAAA